MTVPGSSIPNDASAKHEESPWRISRIPGSVITFASFDPSTASGTGDETNEAAMRKLSLNEELCRPKRIVIETSPDGRSTWRFVPKARWEEGVENEGIWPRVVEVNGKLVTLTQDHWEMYKLDKRYDCLVRLSPMPSLVRRVGDERPPGSAAPKLSAQESFSSQASSFRSRDLRYTRTHLSNHVKRRASTDKPATEKRARTAPSGYSSSSSESSSEDDTAEEDEVNELVSESSGGSSQKSGRSQAQPQPQPQPAKQYQASARLLKVRANIEEARRRRRELTARRKAQLDSIQELKDEDIEMMSCSEIPASALPRAKSAGASPVKRKASDGHISDPPIEDTGDESDGVTPKPRFRTYDKVGASKRTRTLSPNSAKRALRDKRSQWWRRRYDQNRQEAKARAEEREKKQMEELFAEAAERHAREQTEAAQREKRAKAETAQREENAREEAARREARARAQAEAEASSSRASSSAPHTQPKLDTLADEEARRLAMLEESRRKMAELEKDKPLWEEQARKRAAAEANERAHAEAAQKARANADKEREARAKQKAEAERREREDTSAEVRRKRERARQAAIRDGNTWLRRGWSATAALERYKALSEAFDKLNFFRGDVVVFEIIPWPVLKRPNTFGVEDVDWTSVEAFFKEISLYLSATEYKNLVEKSHKRFHPDRWRSRRVLTCVEDEEEKECLEVAANTVAQAITPLWQEVTGR